MTKPLLINQPSLSLAWAQAFLALRATSGHRLAPLTVSFRGFDGPVTSLRTLHSIRARRRHGRRGHAEDPNRGEHHFSAHALWRRAKGNRQAFYAAYLENLPEYVAMAPHKNRRGLYFARLIAYDLDHIGPASDFLTFRRVPSPKTGTSSSSSFNAARRAFASPRSRRLYVRSQPGTTRRPHGSASRASST